MSDPLDDVIAEYEQELTVRLNHEAELRKRAEILVNQWPYAMRNILNEMAGKLQRFGMRIDGCQQDPGPGGGAGAKLSISSSFHNTLSASEDRNFRLELKLTEAGTVKGSVAAAAVSASPDDFKPREIEMGEEFPEEQVRKVLADYAGYRLRHRTSGDRPGHRQVNKPATSFRREL